MADRLAVIIVNYRTPHLALECVAALAAERGRVPPFSVVLVDGGSSDASPSILADGIAQAGWTDWVELLALPINGGFGYANNQALLLLGGREMPPDFACLLNPDAKPLSGALGHMLALLDAHPRAGAVGAQLQGADEHPQGSAFAFPSLFGELSRGANTDLVRKLTRTPPIVFMPAGAARVPWVTGAAVMLRMSALEEVGLFDDGFFLYFEEVELMHRLSCAGWEIWHEPKARVEHIGGSATDIRWDEHGFHKALPLPRYWYRSRRRYLVRTGGALFATVATALFILGRLLWLARSRVQRRPDRFPHRTSRDMFRHSLWPSGGDRAPIRLPRLGDPVGSRPLWQQQEEL